MFLQTKRKPLVRRLKKIKLVNFKEDRLIGYFNSLQIKIIQINYSLKIKNDGKIMIL